MRFLKPIVDNIMQSYPGATFHLDTRQAFAKEYYEYWVSIIPQSAARHVCHLPWKAGLVEIEPPADTVEFLYEQPTYETESPVNLSSLGPATTAPLGYVVHARSGDKGSDSNVGFFVRNADEWAWLRSLLTVSKIRELLGEDDKGKPIFRFELPHLFGESSAVRPFLFFNRFSCSYRRVRNSCAFSSQGSPGSRRHRQLVVRLPQQEPSGISAMQARLRSGSVLGSWQDLKAAFRFALDW